MNVLICPSCKTALDRRSTKVGLVWVCPTCRGRALTLQVLRKAVSRNVVNQLWQWARTSRLPRKRACPACKRHMAEVVVPAKPSAEALDVCIACHFVWFDRGELAALPKAPTQPIDEEPMSPKAREAIAMARLETAKLASVDHGPDDEGPDHWYDYILGFVGMPVEHNDTPLACHPWVTWLTCAVIALVSILAFRNLDGAVANWGMIPARFMRHGGLTFITSFFLHGNPWHLAGNLYFLWVFGDNVEDILGKGRFVLLLVVAALVGDITHILSEPSSTIPAIGASGGISGVIAYYALRFPHARIGLLLRYWLYFHWLRIPVWVMFALWVAFQVWGACVGSNGVAVFAHLGGAVVGVVFWWLTRHSVASPKPTTCPERTP